MNHRIEPSENSFTEEQFHPAKDINWLGEDVWAEIKCPCGEVLAFGEGYEMRRCECGRVYRLRFFMEVAP